MTTRDRTMKMECTSDGDKELADNKMRVMEKIAKWGDTWYFKAETMEKMMEMREVVLIIYVDGGAKQLQAEDVIGPAWAPSGAWGNVIIAKCDDENLFMGNMCGPVVTKEAPQELQHRNIGAVFATSETAELSGYGYGLKNAITIAEMMPWVRFGVELRGDCVNAEGKVQGKIANKMNMAMSMNLRLLLTEVKQMKNVDGVKFVHVQTQHGKQTVRDEWQQVCNEMMKCGLGGDIAPILR